MATLDNLGSTLQRKLENSLGTLPAELGNEGVTWTKENFRRQGWPGVTLTPWKPRKANARRNTGRGILINSARLSRSPRLISTGPLRADFGTDVPYARAHNDGFTGTVTVRSHRRNKIGSINVSTGKTGQPFKKKKTIVGVSNVKSFQRHMNLPQRKFIGNSPILVSILRKKAVVHVGRDLKA